MFNRDSPCLLPLREMIEEQAHSTLVLWALDCAERFLWIFEKSCPGDLRPREMLTLCHQWKVGEIKMPLAKQTILQAHRAATQAADFPAAQAAARAVCHACASIHVETHALGLVLYGLTALVYEKTPDDVATFADNECAWFMNRLSFWAREAPHHEHLLAPFLTRPGKTNKKTKENQFGKQEKELSTQAQPFFSSSLSIKYMASSKALILRATKVICDPSLSAFSLPSRVFDTSWSLCSREAICRLASRRSSFA